MGIVVGGLLAMGATAVQRELLRRAGTRLIDWEGVRRIARRRLGAAGAGLTAADRAAAEAFYRAELLRIEPIVAEAIGAELPRALETPAVVDRFEWIDLNLATFEQLFGRVERIISDATTGADTPGRALARIRGRTEVLGPFDPPGPDETREAFIARMRGLMVEHLAVMRARG